MDSISVGWKKFWPVFTANLIYSLHYAAILYINSTFLGKFFSWQTIAIFYAIGSIGNIILFVRAPRYLRRFGNRSLFTLSIVAEAVAAIGLALAKSALPAAGFFILYGAVSMLVYYSLDIALESVTINNKTGEIRGAYLTVANITNALAPLIVAARVFDGSFAPVYAVAAVVLLPLFLIAPFFPPDSPANHSKSSALPLNLWWKFGDVRRVTLARGLLEFFYTIMVIFMPVYLYEYLHFSWAEIGVLFSIMLFAFVFFEWLVGELADRFWGEKEMMTLGFFVMGTSVLVMPFLGPNFTLWAVILFVSRIGATLTEMTCESYFWKHVSAADIGFITIYRTIRPLATIIGAIVGASLLALMPFAWMFFVLAIFMLSGMRESAYLIDTK